MEKLKSRTELYTCTNNANQTFVDQLYSSRIALAYLLNRGLTKKSIDAFKIGYSCDEWSNIVNTANGDSKELQTLEDAGLIIQKNERHYDRFRGRIMFPIMDTYDQICGWGGRVIEDEQTKYINSPETPIFSKSNLLYGLHQCLQYNFTPSSLIVVEGYLDVVALFQSDINKAVAPLGTSITEYQLTELYKHTHEVICCYDGDRAGQKAAWRTLIMSLPTLQSDQEIKFTILPEQDDPDSYIRKHGKKSFDNLVENAYDMNAFIGYTLKERHGKNLMAIAEELSELAKIIPASKLDSFMSIYQELFGFDNTSIIKRKIIDERNECNHSLEAEKSVMVP
ncbi:MAG: toprim domain-containing protein [Endozoicomonadaceae bacterium]|nr:toprim domain-containing protein [Endozoicomonadaceae bacterium]